MQDQVLYYCLRLKLQRAVYRHSQLGLFGQ